MTNCSIASEHKPQGVDLVTGHVKYRTLLLYSRAGQRVLPAAGWTCWRQSVHRHGRLQHSYWLTLITLWLVDLVLDAGRRWGGGKWIIASDKTDVKGDSSVSPGITREQLNDIVLCEILIYLFHGHIELCQSLPCTTVITNRTICQWWCESSVYILLSLSNILHSDYSKPYIQRPTQLSSPWRKIK